VFGPYTVLYSLGRWYWTNEDWNPCDSLDAGKLAAEQHYRERLSQALTPAPLAEVVEALKEIAAGMGNLSLDQMGPNGVSGINDGRQRAIYLERFVSLARAALSRHDAGGGVG
jgi:hypothetical protein